MRINYRDHRLVPIGKKIILFYEGLGTPESLIVEGKCESEYFSFMRELTGFNNKTYIVYYNQNYPDFEVRLAQ